MRVAIATDGGQVSPHFGRCGLYTVVEIEGGQIINQEVIENPGHDCGAVPQLLHEKGVEVIVSGGMGAGARQKFDAVGIRPVLGVQGSIRAAIEGLVRGTLVSTESSCEGDGHGHGEGHACQHGH